MPDSKVKFVIEPYKQEEIKFFEEVDLFALAKNEFIQLNSNNSCVITHMPKIKEFPYETTFAAEVKPFQIQSNQIEEAKASLEKLKGFLPSDTDFKENFDLLGVAFNAFVVNKANKNGDVIGTDVALATAKNFVNKPFNIEHKRRFVVGFCTNVGYSEFGTDKPLTEDEVKGSKDPFNVVLGGFVWRVVDKEFATKLEKSSDPSSEEYETISASWELGFKEYNIAKGSDILTEAEIIDDEDEIDKIEGSLKAKGGSGVTPDGQAVYRNIVGTPLPLGIGFTANPAGAVKGVATSSHQEEDEDEDEEREEENDASSTPNIIEEIKNLKDFVVTQLKEKTEVAEAQQKNNKNNSQIKENTVKTTMKKIYASVDELIVDLEINESQASHVREFIQSEIEKASEKWVAEKKQAEEELQAAKNDTKTLQDEIKIVKEELSSIKAEQEAIKANEEFQARNAAINEEYELDEELQSIVAGQIKDLDEEGFAKWKENFDKLAAPYKKGQEAQASQENNQSTNEAIENAQEEAASVANTQTLEEPSLAERMQKAFSIQEGGVTIK